MNRYARDKRPYVRPVEKIELSQKKIKLRMVAAIAFLAVGATTLAYALNTLLSEETGWEEITITSSYAGTCADEFSLIYHLGLGEESATKEQKAVSAIYTEAAGEAYRLFHSSEEFEGVNNIATLNQHPNEAVAVDPVLYDAFSLLDQYDIRLQYLGPACESYNGIFKCTEDVQTADYDPMQNPFLRDYFAQTAAYAADSDAIDLELLEDHQVRLNVSEEYLRFAEENETDRFLDLYWMKNAFAADYMAEKLIESGYPRGVLSSYDGFVRNWDASGDTVFSWQLFDRQEQTVYPAALMQYNGPLSLVYLKSYPVKDQDLQDYYVMETGEVRGAFLNPKDGLPQLPENNLAFYAEDMGCAEVLMRVLDNGAEASAAEPRNENAEELWPDVLSNLVKEGIEMICCRNLVFYHTDSELQLTDFYQSESVSYFGSQIK